MDGGLTYSPRQAWPESNALTGAYADIFTLNLEIPSGTCPEVILRAYNLFDASTESNAYQSPQFYLYGQDEEDTEASDPEVQEPAESAPPSPKNDTLTAGSDQAQEQEETSFLIFLLICLIIVLIVFLLVLVSQSITRRRRRLRRRR